MIHVISSCNAFPFRISSTPPENYCNMSPENWWLGSMIHVLLQWSLSGDEFVDFWGGSFKENWINFNPNFNSSLLLGDGWWGSCRILPFSILFPNWFNFVGFLGNGFLSYRRILPNGFSWDCSGIDHLLDDIFVFESSIRNNLIICFAQKHVECTCYGTTVFTAIYIYIFVYTPLLCFLCSIVWWFRNPQSQAPGMSTLKPSVNPWDKIYQPQLVTGTAS